MVLSSMVKALPIPPVGTRFGRHVIVEVGLRVQPSAQQQRNGALGQRAVRTRCDCGNEKLVALSSLRSGRSTSCGCLKREQTREKWRDPQFRQVSVDRSRDLMRRLWGNQAFAAEVAARMSETNRKLWESPDFRAGVVERAKARMTTHGLSGHPLSGTHGGMMARCYRPTARGYHNYGGRGIRVYAPWHDLTTALTWLDNNLGPRPAGMTLDRIDNDGHYVPGNLKWSSRRDQRLNIGHGVVQSMISPPCAIAGCICGGS